MTDQFPKSKPPMIAAQMPLKPTKAWTADLENRDTYNRATRQVAFFQKLLDFMPQAELAWYEQTGEKDRNDENINRTGYTDFREKLNVGRWDNSKRYLKEFTGTAAEARKAFVRASFAGVWVGDLVLDTTFDLSETQIRDLFGPPMSNDAINAAVAAAIIRDKDGNIVRNPAGEIRYRNPTYKQMMPSGAPGGGKKLTLLLGNYHGGGPGDFSGGDAVYGQTHKTYDQTNVAGTNIVSGFANTWEHNMNMYNAADSWNPFKKQQNTGFMTRAGQDFNTNPELAKLNQMFMSPLEILHNFDGRDIWSQINTSVANARAQSGTDLLDQTDPYTYFGNDVNKFDVYGNYFDIGMSKKWKDWSDEQCFSFVMHAWEAKKRANKAYTDIWGRVYDMPNAVQSIEWNQNTINGMSEADRNTQYARQDLQLGRAAVMHQKMKSWSGNVADRLSNKTMLLPFKLMAMITHTTSAKADAWGYWGDSGLAYGSAYNMTFNLGLYDNSKPINNDGASDFQRKMIRGYLKYISATTSPASGKSPMDKLVATLEGIPGLAGTKLLNATYYQGEADLTVAKKKLNDVTSAYNYWAGRAVESMSEFTTAVDADSASAANKDLAKTTMASIAAARRARTMSHEDAISQLTSLGANYLVTPAARNAALQVESNGLWGEVDQGVLKDVASAEVDRLENTIPKKDGQKVSESEFISYLKGVYSYKDSETRGAKELYLKARESYNVFFDLFEQITDLGLDKADEPYASKLNKAFKDAGGGNVTLTLQRKAGDAGNVTWTGTRANAQLLVTTVRQAIAFLEPVVAGFDPPENRTSPGGKTPDLLTYAATWEGSTTNPGIPRNSNLRVLIDNAGSADFARTVTPDDPAYSVRVDFIPHGNNNGDKTNTIQRTEDYAGTRGYDRVYKAPVIQSVYYSNYGEMFENALTNRTTTTQNVYPFLDSWTNQSRIDTEYVQTGISKGNQLYGLSGAPTATRGRGSRPDGDENWARAAWAYMGTAEFKIALTTTGRMQFNKNLRTQLTTKKKNYNQEKMDWQAEQNQIKKREAKMAAERRAEEKRMQQKSLQAAKSHSVKKKG